MEANLGFVSSDCLRKSRKRYHLYLLRDPDTNQVRYVGCCERPRARYAMHLHGNKSRGKWIGRWVDSLTAVGKKPVMELVCCCVGKANARRIEHRMILEWFGIVGFAICNQQEIRPFFSFERLRSKAIRLRSKIDRDAYWAEYHRNRTPPSLEQYRRKYGLECNGRWLTLLEWSREIGISREALRQRLLRWPQTEALSRPKQIA